MDWQKVQLSLGLCVFQETADSKCYVRLILSPIFSQLTGDKNRAGSSCKIMLLHTLQKVLFDALDEVFGE
jgi:hypothetical protein